MLRRRHSALIVPALLLAACGSTGEAPAAEPSDTPPTSVAPSPTPSKTPPAPDLVPVLRGVKGHSSCEVWLNTVPDRPGFMEYHIGVTIEIKGLDTLPTPTVTVGVRRDGVNNTLATYEFGRNGIPVKGAELYPDAYYVGTSDQIITAEQHPAKEYADKTFELAIEVDPNNRVHEPFENNNIIRVKVHTPAGDKPALGKTRCLG